MIKNLTSATLKIPHICYRFKPTKVTKIKRLINNAIVPSARLHEGSELEGIIVGKSIKLDKIVESISKMTPLINKNSANITKEIITGSLTNAEILSEASNHIIKHDISEELERVVSFEGDAKTLKKKCDHGKHLDVFSRATA